MSDGLKQTSQALGYAQYTDLSDVVSLLDAPDAGHALPATDPAPLGRGPRPLVALLQAEAQNIRWTDDGSDPSATEGMVLFSGDQPFLYDGPLVSLRFIQVTSGAILNVSYYR